MSISFTLKKTLHVFFTLFLLVTSNHTFAQKQKKAPISYSRPYYYLSLTDSFSKLGNIDSASKYLLLTDPYVFICAGVLPDSISGYIDKCYKVAAATRDSFTRAYLHTFNAPRSEVFDTLKKMHEAYIDIWRQLRNCYDNNVYPGLRARLESFDTTYNFYLYNYSLKNGWPSLRNGAYYAGRIGMRCHRHRKYFSNFIKQGFKKGETDGALNNINDSIGGSRFHDGFMDVKLRTQAHICLRVPNLLQYKMPDSMDEIGRVIQQHCPAQYRLKIESNDYLDFKKWFDFKRSDTKEVLTLDEFHRQLSLYSCFSTDPTLWTETHALILDTFFGASLFVFYGPESKDTEEISLKFIHDTLRTQTIHFDFNKATIKPESYEFLLYMATWIKNHPNQKYEIDGFTDEVGTEAFNIELSKSRAKAVKDYLVSFDVPESQLVTNGYGTTRPVAPNTSEENRKLNRRVEFIKLTSSDDTPDTKRVIRVK